MSKSRKPRVEEKEEVPFARLPDDTEELVYSYLDLKDKAVLSRIHKNTSAFFKQMVSAESLSKEVAQGRQDRAEALIKKIRAARGTAALLELLKIKCIITEPSGRTFKLTPFQFALYAKDMRMLKMLQEYLPLTEAALQFHDLKNNKIKYEPVLMTVDPEAKLDPSTLKLRQISIQHENRPMILKQGENLYVYGYDLEDTRWRLTPLNPDIFRNKQGNDLLPFPDRIADIDLRVVSDLSLIPSGKHYILIQEDFGKIPTGFYFQDEQSLCLLEFAINQNMSTLLCALYPDVPNHISYQDLPALSQQQLQAIALATHHGFGFATQNQLTAEMYEELAKGHTQGTEHGLFYDFGRLNEAFRILIENMADWTQEEQDEYWRSMIGGAQDQVPAHVRDEYCQPHRPFYPTPSFEESVFVRGVQPANKQPWYSSEGSGLSKDSAVYRGNKAEAEHCAALPFWGVHNEAAAVYKLDRERTAYMDALVERLLSLAPRVTSVKT